jgi:transcriptional regulator with XRE-family HTH domain
MMPFRRRRLALRRKAMGFSQEQLAERLDIDRSTIGRWESGETVPQPWIRPRLARALQVSLDELDKLLDEGGLPNSEVEQRLDFAFQHPGSTDVVTVAHLRHQVGQLDERYVREPSTALLADAGQYLGQVRFLEAHAANGRVRRELCAVEAEAAILMGQLVWDASQRRDNATAHLYLDQAIRAARQFHDPVAEGLALLRKTIVVLYGEREPRAGLDLARRTAETTTHNSGVLNGLALLHTAEAHAMLGAQASCEAALAEADTQFGRIDVTDAAIDLFSPSQFGRMAGSCYLFLEEHRRARSLLEDTARDLHDQSKPYAIVLGNLALAAIGQGNVDEAAARLNQALDVIEINWGGGGLNIVFGASRELRPWRDVPAVQDVQDRLLSLMATG